MTLDDFIRRRFGKYVSALQNLASMNPDEASVVAVENILSHLRNLYRERKSAFTDFDIERIRTYSVRNKHDYPSAKEEELVSGESGAFVVGNSYLSDHGTFRVLAVNPFPVIEPSVYPTCNTPYFAGYMLDEHNRIFKERGCKWDPDDSARRTLALYFTSPFPSAREEIENWTTCYHAAIEEKHRESLKVLNKKYWGTRDTYKKYRDTYCYSCKSNLDSELFKECCGCGWIICSCGACGCAYYA